MISYKEYLEYKVQNEFDYIKDLIGEGYFESSPKVENATDEELMVLAKKVVEGLEDNNYLNKVLSECENDEIWYWINEDFS